MVVLPFYVMILLATGLFQSITSVHGLSCYQCNHPGTYSSKAHCKPKSCDEDIFHRKLKQRFASALTDLSQLDEAERNQLKLEEYCYLKVDRPIPFDGHSRGCYIHLKFKNTSKRIELNNHPMYEEWILCKTDNCNDMAIPTIQILDEEEEGPPASPEVDSEIDEEEGTAENKTRASDSSCSRPIPLIILPYILTIVVIFAINTLRCSYYLS